MAVPDRFAVAGSARGFWPVADEFGNATTGFRSTAPISGCSMRRVGSTTTRSWTRDWPDCCRWTPRWCGRISTRPAHRRIATQGADPNYKNRRAVEPDDHALGRSRGGLSTKIHALTILLTCAVALSLTAGQAGDNPQLLPLVNGYLAADHTTDTAGDVRLIADKAYSHPSTRTALRRRGIKHTIPERDDQIARRKAKAQPVAAHPCSTPQSTSSATPLNAASTGSSNGAE